MFAVIIGSGFAGLGMAVALRRAGIDDFVILEKAESIGGTWRDNVYPGCACDIPSHLYSFSFERNPRWSATYSPQPEIRQYIEHCANKYDLRRHIRTGIEAKRAVFDERTGLWTVTTSTGEPLTARIVVAGLGPLHRWSFPHIPGGELFLGKMFHSAAWDTSFDPRGKKIAAIGTGASAIQFVPELAKTAEKLHVFQRTPAWVVPRLERQYAEWQKELFERVPFVAELFRSALFWGHEARGYGFTRNPNVLRFLQRVAKRNIERSIKDPSLREKLTPSYVMGCKRILMSNTYYPALAQPNVEVITDSIREMTPAGIVTKDGQERQVDAIVFGTGFDVHDYLGHLQVTGLSGRDLGALWSASGAQAYLGTVVSGFPGFFIMVGPNTGLGHNSIIYMIECQVEYIMKQVRALRDDSGACYDVREEVQRAYNEEIQRRLQKTVWATGCASWYLDAHGRNATLWPGFCFEYQKRTSVFQPQDYERMFVEGRG